MENKTTILLLLCLTISTINVVRPDHAIAELYECTNNKGVVTHHSRVPCPDGYSSKIIQDSSTANKTYTKSPVKILKGKNVEVISRGTLVDLIDHLDYGKYTVFLFYTEWCAPCKAVKPELENYANTKNTFSLKELDVLNWENPLVRYYSLAGLPYFIVYGPDGQFVERGPVLSKELKSKLTQSN